MIFFITHLLGRCAARLIYGRRVIHRGRVPESGGALVVANHTSHLDPPLIVTVFRKPIHTMARKTLFKGFLGWLLPRINVFPVDLGKGDLTSLKKVLALLKAGQRVLIFPEGTRSADGCLQPATAGIGFILSKAQVPVIPMRIFGAHEAWPRGASRPGRGRVTIVVGPPVDFGRIPPGLSTRDQHQACADQVMAAIAALRIDGNESLEAAPGGQQP